MTTGKKIHKGIAAISILAVLAFTYVIMSPVTNAQFTNYDDQGYVKDNKAIRQIDDSHFITKEDESWKPTYVMGNYHPITMLSYAINYRFYELDPKAYHQTNLLLHLLNTLLVFLFIQLLSGSFITAIITALLFGIHPMHLESVAWISERKDLLYVLFGLLSLILYTIYVRSSSMARRSLLIIGTFITFTLSLFSKGLAVTIPLIFIIIDYFLTRLDHVSPLKRIFKLVQYKILFFIVSLVFGIIAILAQQSSESIDVISGYNPIDHFVLACYSLIIYVVKMLIPYDLSVFYGYPLKSGNFLPLVYYLFPAVVIACMYGIYKYFRDDKYIIFGSLFFITTIVLVLQFLPVGFAMMADRYTYLPYLGLFFIIGKIYSSVFARDTQFAKRVFLAATIVMIIAVGFYAGQTFKRTAVWKNSFSLWNDVISNHPNAHMAYNGRGDYYKQKGKYKEALADFTTAIGLYPNYTKGYNNRGNIYGTLGQYDEALEDFEKAIAIDPDYYYSYYNRGVVYLYKKIYHLAVADFNKVLEYNPNHAETYNNRGLIYKNSEEFDLALADYEKAIELDPNNAMAYYNKGYLHYRANDFDLALENLNISLKQNPKYPDSYYMIGLTEHRKNRLDLAVINYTKTLDLNPTHTQALYNRSGAYYSQSKFTLALQDALSARTLGMQVDTGFINAIEERLAEQPQ